MKKTILFFSSLLIAIAIASCTPGSDDALDDKDNFHKGHEWVDLGLSVKWATCNVGATKPEEYGGYYAWGETEEKDDYSWDTYKYCELNGDRYIEPSEIIDIGSDISSSSYDVAHVKWGGKWRMPTDHEFFELSNSCSWQWTTLNGVSGMRVTGKNGNSIFLPAAGSRSDGKINSVKIGAWYRSATLYFSSPWCYVFDYLSERGWANPVFCQYYGYSVRPVCE